MKQCPECGGYMTWYCTATGYHGWRCMCGYDTGNVSVTYSTSITISNDSAKDTGGDYIKNLCREHGMAWMPLPEPYKET